MTSWAPCIRHARGFAACLALAVAVTAASIVAPRPAAAAELPAPVLDRTELRAGEHVVLRWAEIADAEEMELVFTVDNGRHYDVRVSPELSGGECRYVWTVPNVGVRGARVRLRARLDGHETCGPASAAFTIVSDPVRSPGRFSYRHGEWWEDAHGEPFDLPGLVTPARGPALKSDDAATDPAMPAPAGARVPLHLMATALDAGAPPAAMSRPPVSVTQQASRPMRN